MAVPETDLARIRRWATERVPAHVRDQVWIELDVDARSVTIFECRPSWNPELIGPEPTRFPIARLRYVAARKEWECTGGTGTFASTATTSRRRARPSGSSSMRSMRTAPRSSGDRHWPAGVVTPSTAGTVIPRGIGSFGRVDQEVGRSGGEGDAGEIAAADG